MPFRLDHAIWVASVAITLITRVSLLVKTEKKYVGMKYATWAIDYCYAGLTLYFVEKYLVTDFTPEKVFVHQVLNSTFVCLIDILKALLFSSLLPKAKLDHLKSLGKSLLDAMFTVDGIKANFKFLGSLLAGQGTAFEWEEDKTTVRKSVRHQLWYFFKIGVSNYLDFCAESFYFR